MMGDHGIDDRVADGEHSGRSGDDHLSERKPPREAWTYEKGRIHEVDVHDEIAVERLALTAQIEDDRTPEGHDDTLRRDGSLPACPHPRAAPPEITRWARRWPRRDKRSATASSSPAPRLLAQAPRCTWRPARHPAMPDEALPDTARPIGQRSAPAPTRD